MCSLVSHLTSLVEVACYCCCLGGPLGATSIQSCLSQVYPNWPVVYAESEPPASSLLVGPQVPRYSLCGHYIELGLKRLYEHTFHYNN